MDILMRNNFYRIVAVILLTFSTVLYLHAQVSGGSRNPNLQTLGHPINSLDNSEFAPTISADGNTLIFESDRDNRWRLYISSKVNGVWSAPKELTAINNSVKPGDFLGGPCLSYDGKTLFFTSNREGGIGGMDIWYSTRTGDVWAAPKNLGRTINSAGYDGFASLSPDGKWLYFMRESDRPGTTSTGQRCCRLMIAEKRGAFFINPKPLPTPIYSGCEGYPRIMADGRTLIFSSQRTGGKGGYDLYESKYKNGKWSNPIPLEFINTAKDDELISVPASGDIMYLSNTSSNNRDDIYRIELPKEFRPEQVVVVEGTVKDADYNKPLPATIKVNNIKSKEKVMEVNNDSLTGRYTLYLEKGQKYDVSYNAQGKSFESEVIDLQSTEKYQRVAKNIKLKSLKPNTSFTLNNIFFEFDSSSLDQESTLELERVYDLMIKNPTMQVEISAHTDDKGSDEYNNKLSQARAESVVTYLVQKGIAKERMVAKGYGETKPAVLNDTDENRAKNRRVEFKILKI